MEDNLCNLLVTVSTLALQQNVTRQDTNTYICTRYACYKTIILMTGNYIRPDFYSREEFSGKYIFCLSLLSAVKFIGSRVISQEVTPFTIIDINTRPPDTKRADAFIIPSVSFALLPPFHRNTYRNFFATFMVFQWCNFTVNIT